MNKPFWLRVRAALLPLAFFALLYPVYLYFLYWSHPDMPKEERNWGYVMGAVLLITRVINLLSLPKQKDHRALLGWSLIGYNLLIVLGAWLLVGNVMAFAALLQPFGENVTLHILLLLLLSLGLSAELLWSPAPETATEPDEL